MRPPIHAARGACALLLAGLALVPAAHAQRTGDGFLFSEPRAALTVRGGYAAASAGSDVFSFSREQLELGSRDFDGVLLAGDLSWRLAPRLDLALGAGYYGREAPSEMREWVGEDDLPIAQTTSFRRVPLTATVRAYPLPRGRSIGQFVWIPARVSPYLGAGGGTLWYRFRQEGEFVDYETLDIFYDVFSSSGWTATAHGVAGLEVALTPRLALVTEGRYDWAEAELSRDFEDFEPIDLSGLSASLGLQVRF